MFTLIFVIGRPYTHRYFFSNTPLDLKASICQLNVKRKLRLVRISQLRFDNDSARHRERSSVRKTVNMLIFHYASAHGSAIAES
jgi:hypothetical protein